MTIDQPGADRKFIFLVAVVAIIVAAIPYVFGQALTPSGYVFQGNTVLAPGDPNVYYSYIEQARQGAILMRDVFTSEPHPATLWQPVWLILGWAAEVFHLTTPAIFAFGRIASLAVFIMTVWWATGWIWPDRIARRIATLLVLGGSGVGGIVVWLGNMNLGLTLGLPPDMWVSEMVPMLSAWASPHFLLVTSGFLFVLVAVERSWQEKNWRLMWWAGLVSLITLSIHPFHVLTWTLLWIGLTLWRWKTERTVPVGYCIRWIFILLVSLPALSYYLAGLVADPIIQGRALQNINLTPSWWKVLVAIGGIGILAVMGVIRMRRQGATRMTWVIGWAIIHSLVIYLPFSGQRRLMQGLLIPIALLAVPAVMALWHRLGGNQLKQVAACAGLFLVLGSSTILTGGRIAQDYHRERQGRNHWEYFLSPEYQELFSYIKGRPGKQQPIIASAWDSVLLAGFTGQTVVGGHPVETLRYKDKIRDMERFFRSSNQAERAMILRRYKACFILDGPRERAYGGTWDPASWPNLKEAWTGSSMRLYTVTDCESAG